MEGRIPRSFGSVITLVGAFAVGGVVHEVVIEGTVRPLSPVAVLGVLAGVALIIAGRRLEREFDPSAYVPDEPEEDEEEFDDDLSPVPSEELEDREADDG